MRARLAVMLGLVGCAQLAGIDQTSKGSPIDAPAVDMPPPIDMPVDAPPCVGGDARIEDAATGACYIFFVAPLPQANAAAMCATLGAGTLLVSIQSDAENTLVQQLIGANLAFLGGNDIATESVFLWPDGSALTFLKFNAGEPNNGAGQVPGGEDCLIMHGELAGVWDDRPCAPVGGIATPGAYSYVCERD
jgi:hypothetical protein